MFHHKHCITKDLCDMYAVRTLRIANKVTRRVVKMPFRCFEDYEKSLELAKDFCKRRDYRFISLSRKTKPTKIRVLRRKGYDNA